jgi:hypothetical protein
METDLATIDEEQVAELLDRSVNDLRTLDGVQAKLEAGAQVADVGCGHGASANAGLAERCRLLVEPYGGERRLREVVTAAGFGRFRRIAQTPFNLVYEARP